MSRISILRFTDLFLITSMAGKSKGARLKSTCRHSVCRSPSSGMRRNALAKIIGLGTRARPLHLTVLSATGPDFSSQIRTFVLDHEGDSRQHFRSIASTPEQGEPGEASKPTRIRQAARTTNDCARLQCHARTQPATLSSFLLHDPKYHLRLVRNIGR